MPPPLLREDLWLQGCQSLRASSTRDPWRAKKSEPGDWAVKYFLATSQGLGAKYLVEDSKQLRVLTKAKDKDRFHAGFFQECGVGHRERARVLTVVINWVPCGDPPLIVPPPPGLLELQSPPLYSDGGNNRPFSVAIERPLMKEPPFPQSLLVRNPAFTGGLLLARPPTELYTSPRPRPPTSHHVAPSW